MYRLIYIIKNGLLSLEKSVCGLFRCVFYHRFYDIIGDVRNFHSKHALIAYAGIDAPPYQSGGFYGTERHISKRGNGYLRRVGFEIMQCKLRFKPEGDVVYPRSEKGLPDPWCWADIP